MSRELKPAEREAAMYLIGMHNAYSVRGYPKSLSRPPFFTAVEVALEIAKSDRVAPLGEAALSLMMSVASQAGINRYRTTSDREASSE